MLFSILRSSEIHHHSPMNGRKKAHTTEQFSIEKKRTVWFLVGGIREIDIFHLRIIFDAVRLHVVCVNVSDSPMSMKTFNAHCIYFLPGLPNKRFKMKFPLVGFFRLISEAIFSTFDCFAIASMFNLTSSFLWWIHAHVVSQHTYQTIVMHKFWFFMEGKWANIKVNASQIIIKKIDPIVSELNAI